MFVLPCKYISFCQINQAVAAIREYHPNEKILVVDSDSEDKSYFESLIPYDVIVADIANQHYESGAFWYAVDQYPNEPHYVVMQDSIVFNKSITPFIEATELFSCFMHFIEMSHSNYAGAETQLWIARINEMLSDLEPISNNDPTTIVGVFGPNFIAKAEYVRMLKSHGLDKTIRPENKIDHQATERVYGIVANRLGVDLTKNTLLGDFHQVRIGKIDQANEKLYTEYFVKTWFNLIRK